jgi:hypothetical protein
VKLGAPYALEDELTTRIRGSLSLYLQVPESDIIISPNQEKYHEKEDPSRASEPLEEVFRLMRELNDIGLRNSELGTSEHKKVAFVQTLEQIAEDIARKMGDGPLQYTELGPEPSKTKFILRTLLENGVEIRRYSGVDINPTSRSTMERELAELLPEELIHYHLVLFEDLKETDFRLPAIKNLVTMLGFEEGNEHPRKTREMLDGILGSGDLLLSEMQLLPRGDWSPIFNFYQSEEMRRFSEVTFRRTHPTLKSEYGVYLVPVRLAGFDPLMVAVTAEKIVDDEGLRDKIFVTNYCLKYTYESYVDLREAGGKFRVLSQRATGDGSVAFQLSEKV